MPKAKPLSKAAKRDLRHMREYIYIKPKDMRMSPKERQRLKGRGLISYQVTKGVGGHWRITNKGKKFVDLGFKLPKTKKYAQPHMYPYH